MENIRVKLPSGENTPGQVGSPEPIPDCDSKGWGATEGLRGADRRGTMQGRIMVAPGNPGRVWHQPTLSRGQKIHEVVSGAVWRHLSLGTAEETEKLNPGR